MSYSDAEIDFSGIHVACLIGPNGAGKSSLLDAITWTIWEEGRARTDELIRLGTNEMSCELEFFMEDKLFRVYRSRIKAFKNSQGKSNLEFQIFNPKENNWASLTKSSTRQTQDLIIETLKMNHDTFTNSVYLKQGKADEFTLKGPNERKQILADILELEAFDKLSEAAKQKTKEIDQNISLEESLVLDLKSKVLKEEESKSLFEKIKEEVVILQAHVEEIKKILNEKSKELNEKKEREKQIQALEKSKEVQEQLIQTLKIQFKNNELKLQKFEDMTKNKNQIENEYKEYIDLKNKIESREKDKETYNSLNLEKNKLEAEFKEKIKQIEKELAIYKSKMDDRKNDKVKIESKLKNEGKFFNLLDRAENDIKEVRFSQEELTKVEKEGQELKYNKELILADFKKVSEKKNEINHKINTLISHNHLEPCPLCKSHIKDKEKVIELYKLEIETYEKEEIKLNHELRKKENELIERRNDYNKLKEKINNFGKIANEYLLELEEINIEINTTKNLGKSEPIEVASLLTTQIEVSKSSYKKAKEELLVINREINGCNEEMNSLNNLLSSGELVKEISEKLNNITKELSKINYDLNTHNMLKNKLKEKENIVLTYNYLIQAEKEIPGLQNETENLASQIKFGQSKLEESEKIISENKEQILNIGALTQEIEEIKEKEVQVTIKLEQVKKQLIITEQSLADIEDSKRLITEKEKKIKESLNNKKHYEILEKAFSKNGIQVAIIETVVPEIEKEANRILNRLTENQMHIALKTQREKKSSEGMKETLDVVIADNVGTRNYELYSGGEAFKIDFALRLALSRVLANRSGAKLQTLIIDEGFGSQDTAGKERLIEVIKSIQNEFELILVVTHLDELKEAFEAQIQVTKENDGSKVRLVA